MYVCMDGWIDGGKEKEGGGGNCESLFQSSWDLSKEFASYFTEKMGTGDH